MTVTASVSVYLSDGDNVQITLQLFMLLYATCTAKRIMSTPHFVAKHNKMEITKKYFYKLFLYKYMYGLYCQLNGSSFEINNDLEA